MLLRVFRFRRINVRKFQSLVSTEWLNDNLRETGAGQSKYRVLQSSWSGGKDYQSCHIAGAFCFDGNRCRDTESQYKNMLPSPQKFADYVSELGVSNDTHVIVYDADSKYPSTTYGTRVWFMFRVFGHEKVSILNGGLYKWILEQKPTDKGFPVGKPLPGNFVANYRPEMVASFEEVRKAQKENTQILDARPGPTFVREETLPDGTNAGHIKGAKSLPMFNFIDPETKLMLEDNKLKEQFSKASLSLDRPIVSTCGTGVYACAAIFAAHRLGHELPLYDGSWYEFSRNAPDEAIEVGKPKE